MRYTTLFLSVLGLGVLCASAPIDSSDTSLETVSSNDTVAAAAPGSTDPSGEEDADDPFVYQWRQ
ncbi:hypothetical protein GGS23DRAFT_600487 [Durotheca rogersii]|uniref:uncharacterized protein n=1 Tax=Durotheca rogersii TaxID=419775 RepID=UPI002220276B|nr:uncharacterized protein GGS23DRAFT_600487 [Durotheca rogersii]KAI5859359.1 hypothetical protein GGS23DRAFT_600487 [Durotheca rogersii]